MTDESIPGKQSTSGIKVPKTLQEHVNEWRTSPDRPVLLIDETRRPLYDDLHKEFILFTAICIPAGLLMDFLADMGELRKGLPPEVRQDSFKGKDLIHLSTTNVQFNPFVGRIAKTVVPPIRIFTVATTIKNIQDADIKVSISAEKDIGRPSVVKGQELKPVLNFIRHLGDVVGKESGRVDVIIDRSDALGLAPKRRQLGENQSEAFYGQLIKGQGPDFAIISDSDEGAFRDALLLPDFVGYLLVYKTTSMMKPDQEKVTSPEGPPFFQREVPLPGLPSWQE